MGDIAVVARSPISPAPPVEVVDGWEVSTRRTSAPLTLVDETPRAKVQLRAHWSSVVAAASGVPFGRAARDEDGRLLVGSGPGEWLVLGAPNTAGDVIATMEAQAAADTAGAVVSVVDVTHGRALMRLTGDDAPASLAKVCAVDFADRVTPNGAAFRSSVAKLVTDVIRDDRSGTRSYLLHCERSSGQYLFDAILDAGAEFGIDVAGFAKEPLQ